MTDVTTPDRLLSADREREDAVYDALRVTDWTDDMDRMAATFWKALTAQGFTVAALSSPETTPAGVLALDEAIAALLGTPRPTIGMEDPVERVKEWEMAVQRVRIAYGAYRGQVEMCPVPSSVTGQPCLLPVGHPQDSADRFHRYAAPSTPAGVLDEAALERLRAIEAASREYLAHDGSGLGLDADNPWRGDYDGPVNFANLRALRAALGRSGSRPLHTAARSAGAVPATGQPAQPGKPCYCDAPHPQHGEWP